MAGFCFPVSDDKVLEEARGYGYETTEIRFDFPYPSHFVRMRQRYHFSVEAGSKRDGGSKYNRIGSSGSNPIGGSNGYPIGSTDGSRNGSSYGSPVGGPDESSISGWGE